MITLQITPNQSAARNRKNERSKLRLSDALSVFVGMLLTLTLSFIGAVLLPRMAEAQEILSKQPPVERYFDSQNNESTVLTIFFNPMARPIGNSVTLDAERPRPLTLIRAEYSYPGKTASRPEKVVFIFTPLEKYKTPPHFFLKVDETVVQEGEVVLLESCCVKAKGDTFTTQQVTVPVSTDAFVQLTKSKKVEIKVASKSDSHTFKLNDYEKKCVAALASTIKQ